MVHPLNLEVDIVFVDTTSTDWEMEVAAESAETAVGQDEDGGSLPEQEDARLFGHSKDHRDDLPQVVIAMAVTRDGIPVRCWTFPGDTGDQKIIRKIKDDLGGWNLRRLVWVADRARSFAANRAYLARGGGHYIHAEKLRNTNAEAAAALARPAATAPSPGTCGSRRRGCQPGTPGSGRSGSWCATTPSRPGGTGWSAAGS